VSDREREGRKWTWGQLTPASLGPRAERGSGFFERGEPGRDAKLVLSFTTGHG
jgi:hypothetical protein